MGKTCRRPGETFTFLPGHEYLITPVEERDKLVPHTYKVVRKQVGDHCSNCAFYQNKHCILSMLEKRFNTGWCSRTQRKVPVYFIKIN